MLIKSQIWQTYSQNTTIFIIATGGTLSCQQLHENNAECSVSNAHPCWAPYTLVQVRNPIAAELHYFEHCYREHFVSVPLELM